jgi:hypothetical protein
MVRPRERVNATPKPAAQPGQPLIGVFIDPNDDDLTFFASEAEAEAAITEEAIRDALAQAGVWSDLDWDELEAALEEIDRGGTATPPPGE